MIINPPSINIPADFSFRKATNTDCKAVQSIVFDALIEYGLVPEPDAADNDLYDIEANYTGGFFGIIEHHGQIVTTFALSELSDSEAEIRKMYTVKDARGKGLGKWMVNYLIQIARDNNYQIVELETASSLVEAIGLYEKFGFVEKDFENKTPRCDRAFYLRIQ